MTWLPGLPRLPGRPGRRAIWGLIAAAALLWPGRLSGVFDGVPLDRTAEAIAIGVLLPALWWFQPAFLSTLRARGCIVALLLVRVIAGTVLVQDGWCVRFMPTRPYVKDGTGAPHAWDLRADWRSPDPACSAVMTRAYQSYREFPVWFFNLPPPNDSWPQPEDRPPEATVAISVHGYLAAPHDGMLRLDLDRGVDVAMRVDGGPPVNPGQNGTRLARGTHAITIDGTLRGTLWKLVPLWNDEDLWSSHLGTMRRPTRVDLFVRNWLAWMPTVLVLALLAMWIASALASVANAAVIAWSALTSALIVALVLTDRVDGARNVIAALSLAVLMPTPRRLQSMRGAFLLIGAPWIAFVAACAAPAAGRFVLYPWGHDYWTFQRFAYRIVMQDYWLEGGSPTFWFQPLYRWIAGLLHMAFGDASIGEWFWDGGCLLAGSLFAYRIARRYAGFRWGLVAAILPLAIVELGTPRDLIGMGLSEITSAGLLSAAALAAMRGRHGRVPTIVACGVLATLAFYTRLNNLIMAGGIALFAIPPDVPAAALWRIGTWRRRTSIAVVVGVVATLAAGVIAFAWRTWHYTGVFSVFYGTQRQLMAIWQPNLSIGAVVSRAIDSVLMVLTVNDPPAFSSYSLPVLAGAIVAVLAMSGVAKLRDVPLAPVLFFFSGIASAFIARGTAYPGRFSLHVIPIASALAVCGVAALTKRRSHQEAVIQQQVLEPHQPAG